jgi:hypothetical protein
VDAVDFDDGLCAVYPAARLESTVSLPKLIQSSFNQKNERAKRGN